MSEPFFDSSGIRTVKITDWLDWASQAPGTEGKPYIVLPMIQRGSVWKPHQVMDLWDTLLRGMPLGSMMASTVTHEAEYFTPINRELVKIQPGNALSLLDGQQRTLAMLLAWPAVGDVMNRRIWVDLGADDKTDHLFRYHFTTENHPFGFQLAGASGSAVGKLSLVDRRKALNLHEAIYGETSREIATRKKELWERSVPWHGVLPVDLRSLLHESAQDLTAFQAVISKEREQLIACLEAGLRKTTLDSQAIERKLEELRSVTAEILNTRVRKLHAAVTAFKNQHMPVIEVPVGTLDPGEEADERDPPLAVLFQRIGTGGTALSNADYVYSVLKYHNPGCHSLVSAMLGNDRVAAIFTPVALVAAAVRLTAATSDGNHPDYAKIDKSQFARLVKSKEFLENFDRGIKEGGSFRHALNCLLNALKYNKNLDGDIGLPKHALCLVELPVLEVLLFWLLKNQALNTEDVLEENRHRLIRFVIYCALTVSDFDKASTVLFRKIKEFPTTADFPEELLVKELLKESLALPIRAPDHYKQHPVLRKLVESPEGVTGLRGWNRFSLEKLAGSDTALESETYTVLEHAIALYRRFWNRRQPWNHRHELLLWLQRDYVGRQFEEIPALPGAEEETPFDYDHICPQSHWNGWTGIATKDRIIDFCDAATDPASQPQSLLGNCIGNLRVWDSSVNRSDGDASPSDKLHLNANCQDIARVVAMRNSVISEQEAKDWMDCSSTSSGTSRQWTPERASAFQRAIENRTFRLFEKFHADLEFDLYETWENPATASVKHTA